MKKQLMFTVIISLFIGNTFNGSNSAVSTPNDSQNPAVLKIKQIINVINTNNTDTTKSYILENFDPEFLKAMPMHDLLQFFWGVHHEHGSLEFQSVMTSKPTSAVVIVTSQTTDLLDNQFVLHLQLNEMNFLIEELNFNPKIEAPCTQKLTKKVVARQIDTFIKKLVSADLWSGTILLAQHGKPFYIQAFGPMNKDFNVANNINTKFNIASACKMFTAVAIGQLIEAGKLSLEDTLDKFLPDFPNAIDAKKIKIKHLLSHTSGLDNYYTKDKIDASNYDLLRTIDGTLKLADDKKIAFEPGSKDQYSNTGYLILGKIIQLVSNQDYFDYLTEHIFKPSGMLNTDFYGEDKVNHNLATGYLKNFTATNCTYENNIFKKGMVRGSPAGGGYSTVKDLLKFDKALRNNTLLSAACKQKFITAKPELNSPHYGYGFGVEPECIWHNGHLPGAHSMIKMYQESGYTTIILSNYDGYWQNAIVNKVDYLIQCLRINE